MHLTAHAQETAIRSSDGDSLRYSYTPLPPQAPEKRPFLRRVVDYFGESTTDKTFEKKIDFTFAGGPSYSKNTSFGIGLLAAGTLPPRPHGLDHGAVGRLDLRQRLGVGLLCAGRDGKQHFLAQQTPHKLYGDVRLGAPQFLGNRLRRRAVQSREHLLRKALSGRRALPARVPAPRLHRRTGELRACAGAEIFRPGLPRRAETAPIRPRASAQFWNTTRGTSSPARSGAST